MVRKLRFTPLSEVRLWQFGLPSSPLPILWMISALFGGRAQRSSLANRFVKKFYSSLPPTFYFSPMSFFFFQAKKRATAPNNFGFSPSNKPAGQIGGRKKCIKGRTAERICKKKVGYAIRLAQLSSCYYYYSGNFCISLSSFWLLVSVCLTCLPPKQQPRKLSEEKATWKTRILMLVEGFFFRLRRPCQSKQH